MHTTRDKYPDFQAFINTQLAVLKELPIPEARYERLYQALVIFNGDLEKIAPELLPWLIADREYCQQNLHEKDKCYVFMLLAAVLSGDIAFLEWISTELTDCLDEAEGETLEYFLLMMLPHSKNFQILQWAIDKHFLTITHQSLLTLAYKNWQEGFLFLHRINPLFFLKPESVPESILIKTGEIFHRSYKISGGFFLYGQGSEENAFGYITGDLQFYSLDAVSSQREYARENAANMILCGLRSGNPEVLVWLKEKQFILTPSGEASKDITQIFPKIFKGNDVYCFDYFSQHLEDAVVCSKNTEILDWALDNLPLSQDSLLKKIDRLDWQEGIQRVARTSFLKNSIFARNNAKANCRIEKDAAQISHTP